SSSTWFREAISSGRAPTLATQNYFLDLFRVNGHTRHPMSPQALEYCLSWHCWRGAADSQMETTARWRSPVCTGILWTLLGFSSFRDRKSTRLNSSHEWISY